MSNEPVLRRARIGWLAAAVLLAFGFCYLDVFQTLFRQWLTRDAYSHGVLIPFVSAYLLWLRRERLAAIADKPAYVSGTIVLLSGMALLLAGRSVDIVGLQEASMLIGIVAVVLLLFGRRTLRAVWFPVAYLVFMMPIWDIVTERLYYPSQLFSAGAGSLLLQAIGIPVFRRGTFLYLPTVTLEVADACSGINYLIAVAAVGIPLAYTLFSEQWKRATLLVFALVIAIVGNPVRVAVIGFLLQRGYSHDVHGPWHILQGLFVSAVGFVTLLLGAMLLSRVPSRFSPAVRATDSCDGSDCSRVMRRPSVTSALAVCAVLILVGSAHLVPLQHHTDPSDTLPQAPIWIGRWHRTDAPSAQRTSPIESGDSGAWYMYTSDGGPFVRLFVGDLVFSRHDDQRTEYWSDFFELVSPEAIGTPMASSVIVNRGVLRVGAVRVNAYFWYFAGGRRHTSRAIAKLNSAWKMLTGLGPRSGIVMVTGEPGIAMPEEAYASFCRDVIAALERGGEGS